MELEGLCSEIIEVGRAMIRKGLAIGTSGNISARCPDGKAFLITPSGMDYDVLVPEDITLVDMETGEYTGNRKPSIELHLHWNSYKARPDVGGVVHTHSPIASSLAAARRPLPVILDVCAFSFRGRVEVADYGMSGSPQLAENAVRALGTRNAVLMANHGALCVGKDLSAAFSRAELLEKVCLAYVYSVALGGPVELDSDVVSALQGGIGKTYGQTY